MHPMPQMTAEIPAQVVMYPRRNKITQHDLKHELPDWEEVDWSGDETNYSEHAWCPQTENSRSLRLPYRNLYLEDTMRALLDCIMPVATSLWHNIWRPYVLREKRDVNSQALPENLYQTCNKFLRDAQDRSQMFRHTADLDQSILDLLDMHNGEVVEVPGTHNAPWTLTIAENLSGYEVLPKRFQLSTHYRPPKMNNFHRRIADYEMKAWSDDCIVAQKHSYQDLQPDWKKQSNRLSVPCCGTSQHIWVRHRSVITLGELFQTLHRQFSKDCIYHLYLHLDIVASMQKKPERLRKKRLRNQI